MTADERMLVALQLVRVKGVVSAAAIAESLGIAPGELAQTLQSAAGNGWVAESKDKLRITAVGREQLSQRLSLEREAVNHAALLRNYEQFHIVNGDFKQLVTDWQLRGGVPNLHDDAAYDAAVVQRLGGIDVRLAPLLAQMISLAPRLAHYPRRFDKALLKVRSGDTAWLARPIMDSYHTVWFELHEDLIGLLRFTREAEAIRGRAE